MTSQNGADLDPAIRRFIATTAADHARLSGGRTLSVAEAREVAEGVRAPWRAGGPAMHSMRDEQVPTPHGPVRVRLFDPDPNPGKPVLVYIHGGGWTIFSLQTHDRLMREYAARAGVLVIGVDYALSPEAKFPVALEQCVAVARWAGDTAGFGADRITLGGDSAGANLALSTAISLRDASEGGLIDGLILNYGVFDREIEPEYHTRFGGDHYMLTSAEMDMFWENYLADPAGPTPLMATPLLAELAGLPPVLLAVPACDVLTGMSLRLAERLAAANVPCDLKFYEGASHSFLEAVSISDLADRAFNDAVGWLKART